MSVWLTGVTPHLEQVQWIFSIFSTILVHILNFSVYFCRGGLLMCAFCADFFLNCTYLCEEKTLCIYICQRTVKSHIYSFHTYTCRRLLGGLWALQPWWWVRKDKREKGNNVVNTNVRGDAPFLHFTMYASA